MCIRFTAPTPLPLLGRQFDLVGLLEVDVGVKRSGRVHEVRRVAESIASPDEFSALPGADRLKVREAFFDETDLIELFVDQNPFHLAEDQRRPANRRGCGSFQFGYVQGRIAG